MRIQNNGLGIQSTVIWIMSHEGLIEPIEHSIFADTQEEPEAVYHHLKWLRTMAAPVPILHVATAGKLGDDLANEISDPHLKTPFPYREHHRHRFASIPAFTAESHETREQLTGCNRGITRRQCTKEYKIEVVERLIRYTILGLKPRQRIPKGTNIVQIFGISWDERGRAERIKRRFEEIPWARPEFPLIEQRMTRDDCIRFLHVGNRVPHETPRSACVFCPFKTASEWLKTKSNPKEWARAVQIDHMLREPGKVVNRGLDQSLYLHRQCIPLEMVDLEAAAKKEAAKKHTPLFALMDCGEGMCGV
jgi:hypothetical protein